MRQSDCARLTKVLLPQLPRFSSNNRCELFISPIRHVWRGFTFESSAASREDFYFWWFFMPMCTPRDHLILNYGSRLDVPGGHAGWRTDMDDLPEKLIEAMQTTALPFLYQVNSIQDTISAIYRHQSETIPQANTGRPVMDIHVRDDLACLYILDGQFEEARAMLDEIIACEHGDDRRHWILDIVARMRGLRSKLLEDPQLAVNQVKEWQEYTLRALKLERWR